MAVQVISESTYWSAMAMRRLGREDQAWALLQMIYDHATALEQNTPKIDFFATSLPTMLLFDEDLKDRQTIASSFLQAQALAGLGDLDGAVALLQRVLERDPSHSGAIDLLGLLHAHER